MRRIAIASAKGGTGKTTTAVSLAHALALSGRSVVLVDCDPKSHVGASFGISPRPGVAALLGGGTADLIEVRAGLQVLTSGGLALLEAETRLAGQPGAGKKLRQALACLPNADYVLLDCAPGLGLLHLSALTASDEIVLPVAADFLSLAGAHQMLASLQALPKSGWVRPRLLGLLPTFCDAEAGNLVDFEATLQQEFAGQVLQARIHHCTAIPASPPRARTIFEWDPLSSGAFDYVLLAEEIEGLAA